MDDYILLCGLGKVGFSILELLRSLGESVVVVTSHIQPDWARRAEAFSERVIMGDARVDHILTEAGIGRAKAVIIVTNDDLVNLEIALDVQRMAPGVPVVVRMFDEELAARVRRDMPVRAVLNAAELSAPAFVAAALGEEVLRAFDIEDNFINIVNLKVTDSASGVGKTIGDIAARLGVVPITISRGKDRHALTPSLNVELMAGDELVVAASKEALAAMQHGEAGAFTFSHTHERPRTSAHAWARPSLGPLRTLRQLWQHTSFSLKVTFLALHTLVLISVLIFHFAMKLAWIDALYFTVTIMTTVGFGDFHLSGAAWPLKLFGCLLMVSGAALLVVVYSVITDYLVTQRFEQALGKRKTTLVGHVVIVGLGNIGYRVAMRLRELGEPVLGIERDKEARAISRLPADIPSLIGDASQREVLEQAGIEHARALAVVTEDDLVNLRIAQCAESMNPSVRTVVRLFQSTLAAKLGMSILGINQPINPSQAAAATFVACALAPNVLQGFTLGGRLFMVCRMDTESVRAVAGKSMSECREEGSAVVLLRSASGTSKYRAARAEEVVGPDDRLIILEEYRPNLPPGPLPCRAGV